MVLDLYWTVGSPPCHAVQMTAKAVGVDLNLKSVNLAIGEHLKKEFLKINPQHTVPTLVDDGFALWESRAIMVYLIEKYGKTASLYPSEPKARAIVNQRLYFDLGTLYQRLADYYYPPVLEKVPHNPENFKKLEDAVGLFNTLLEGQTYAALTDNLTVADISLVATVSALDAAGFDLSKYPNVVTWYERCKTTTPGYDINEAGLVEFKKFLG